MLNRIIIINSDLYAKASILIDDVGSILLAAENNVGKSSFVNALNFLFITDKTQMVFEDGRLLPASMKHYFNGSISHSYIIFEIKNDGYYCIVVKATAENTIEYHKILGAYNESYFITKNGNEFSPKNFDKEVLRDIQKDRPKDAPVLLKAEELYNLVYNIDGKTNPVVWIKSNVKRKTNSYNNSFTDIYRHLLKTSAIDEKAFKYALLVADNKYEVELNVFNDRNQSEINDFEKRRKNLENLRATQKEFEQLKLLHQKCLVTETLLGKLKHTFISFFNSLEKDLATNTAEDGIMAINIRMLKLKIDETLKKDRDELRDARTTSSINKTAIDSTITALQNELNELSSYEPSDKNLLFKGLVDGVKVDRDELNNLQADITLQQRHNFTEKDLVANITALNKEIAELKTDIDDFADLVQQNIAADKKTRQKVITYLSDDVLRLNKKHINDYVENADSPLTIFEGSIDVSNIPLKPIRTKEELGLRIEQLKRQLEEKNGQLVTQKNLNAKISQIESLAADIKSREVLIQRIKGKPEKQAELAAAIFRSENYKTEISALANSISAKELEIENETNALQNAERQFGNLVNRLKNIRGWYKTVSAHTEIVEVKEKLEGDIEKVYEKFEETLVPHSNSKNVRLELFQRLTKILDYDGMDVQKFIDNTTEEFANIKISENALTALSETLTNKFALPTSQFLEKLHIFKSFIYSFNKKLSNYPVSNIREIKIELKEAGDLVKDLRRIGNLRPQRFDFDSTEANNPNMGIENQNTLKRYFSDSKGKTYTLDELFSLSIEITKNNGDRDTVKLTGHGQGQSKGTNIVMKLILYMSILKDFVHSNKENKIVLYIDELDSIGSKNIKTLTKFCREHHFVPLFAAPRKIEGVEKYYVVKEPVRKGDNDKTKIIFDERNVTSVKYINAE